MINFDSFFEMLFSLGEVIEEDEAREIFKKNTKNKKYMTFEDFIHIFRKEPHTIRYKK